jgi:hypothetical protein
MRPRCAWLAHDADAFRHESLARSEPQQVFSLSRRHTTPADRRGHAEQVRRSRSAHL